jgi:hypothetical protein
VLSGKLKSNDINELQIIEHLEKICIQSHLFVNLVLLFRPMFLLQKAYSIYYGPYVQTMMSPPDIWIRNFFPRNCRTMLFYLTVTDLARLRG